MYRSTVLKPSHYAGQWMIPEKDQHNDLRAVNILGYAYATAPDGPEKEAKLLQVLELFHGYMMKYLCMIIRGTVPPVNTYAGRDSKELLRTLAPRGAEPSKALTDYVCKTLHLAFKQQTTEEIYDTLVFCFMKAARKYDPYYADKTRKVCEVISELPAREISRELLENRIDFDCIGILRSLVSKGFLTSHVVKKKVMGYTRGPKWPAPASYFQSGPIGFVYMLQIWFRYYFKEHISEQMLELETNDGVLQLNDAGTSSSVVGSNNTQDGGHGEVIQPHAEGNCLNATGTFRFMADRDLMDR